MTQMIFFKTILKLNSRSDITQTVHLKAYSSVSACQAIFKDMLLCEKLQIRDFVGGKFHYS
jgi:hypothetical protein